MNNLLCVNWEVLGVLSSTFCALVAIAVSLATFWYSNKRKLKLRVDYSIKLKMRSKEASLKTIEDISENIEFDYFYNIEIQNIGNLPLPILETGIIVKDNGDIFKFAQPHFNFSEKVQFPLKLEAKDLLILTVYKDEIEKLIKEKDIKVEFYCKSSIGMKKVPINLEIKENFKIGEINVTK